LHFYGGTNVIDGGGTDCAKTLSDAVLSKKGENSRTSGYAYHHQKWGVNSPSISEAGSI